MTIFSMQLRATFLILLIVVLRSLFLYKLPKKVFLGLWALVLARLLIPYSWNLPLGFSLPSIETIWFSLRPVMGGVIGAESVNGITANMAFTTYSISGFLY